MEFKKLNNFYLSYTKYKVKDFPNLDFLHSIDRNKKVDALKWSDVSKKDRNIFKFLKYPGVKKGDRAMLVSEERPEWMISDLSILANDAITVPNYTTYTQKDFEFVLKDADPIGLIVSSEKLLKTILDACVKLIFNLNLL